LAQNFAAPFHLRVINRDQPLSVLGPTLTLALHPDPQKNPESYTLDITPNDISISAPTPAGAFYALQTLRQLFPPDLEAPLPYIAPTTQPTPVNSMQLPSNAVAEPADAPPIPTDDNPMFDAPPVDNTPHHYVPSLRPLFALKEPSAETSFPLPCLHIEDAPRYPWRGILLDCSRHFFPKQYILRTIDALALHKFNTLHWHLTDDQGWRIEILQYPKLTTISAFRSREDPASARAKTGTTTNPNTTTTQPAPDTDEHYGGFYTQDDIREIVAYAATRFITVVPEIEMPGHSTAVLAAYPELACTPGPFHVGTRWGVFKDIYCPSEQTFTFLQNTLDEVSQLFPSPYIHIGGDEVPKDRWKASDYCQALIKQEHLKNEDELQSFFVHKMGDYLLNQKQKRFIGWDEIMEGGLAPGAIVQSWRGTAGGKAAALADGGGHDVIMSPQSHCYLDHPYQPDDNNPNNHFAAVPLDKTYNFNPMPEGLTPAQSKHILGAEGNLWSEHIPTPERADYMTFPRACALAEVLWTNPDFHDGSRDFPSFSARLQQHFQLLKSLNIHYFDDPVAHATLLASWKPGDFQKQPTTRDYDITDQLKTRSPGPLKIRLDLTNGQNKLDITSLSLSENEKEIARDAHPASAATRSTATLYTLNIPSLNPAARYTLHLTARADTGPDTFGDILLLPITPTQKE
ncbi:MAG: beta-N-acetylhexosaminidase, partial [Phycisphaerae bacterium]